MILDMRTLLIAHSAVSLTLAALLFAFWLGHRSTPGLAQWTVGMTLIGLGVVAGVLRGYIPNVASIVLANLAGMAGLAAFWNGIRLFHGRPARWIVVLSTSAGIAAVIARQTYVVDDIAGRMLVVSIAYSAGCCLCAYELARGAIRTVRNPSVLAAALFGALAVVLAFRAISAIVAPPEPSLFAPGLAQSAYFLVALVAKILLIVALLMMALQRLQTELEGRNADLEVARARAEEASGAKTEFLATMSHELRTPLNAIIGFSDVQRQEMFGPLGHPRYREYAEHIHASGTHLLDLITSILDISKAEAGKLEVAPVDLDPRSILDVTLPLIRGAAEAKGIRLSVDVPDERLVCRADPQALKQILLNLLSNAVKFTPASGGVAVRLRGLDAEAVEFTVIDTGVGIAPSELPRLMKPFEQSAHGYSRQNGGTGLGLPLVDSLVRLHGGQLRIDSALGVGTTVTVRLPTPPRLVLAAAS